MINYLEEILNEISKELGYTERLDVIVSNRPELCDYQCDKVFSLAKIYHKNPMIIGEEIVTKLNEMDNFNDTFKSVEFVKPGFINIILSDKIINKFIIKMNNTEKFGINKPESQELFFLDYGGPNIAKPLHVGHMRTAIVGESIKRIINFKGHKTMCDVHLGDYGLPIGQVIYSIKKDKVEKENITLEYLEVVYPKMSGLCKVNEEVKNECAQITKELQDGKNDYYNELFKIILKISGDDIKRLYNYLGVSFDLWQGESDSYPYLDQCEEILKGKNLLELSQGAKVVYVNKEDDKQEVPPLIFQKSNGAYLYESTDVATIYERVTKYKPDHILYIVDNRQELHFERVFRTVEKMDLIKQDALEFLGYGTVNGVDGKPYKTRSGDAPKLDSLFEQIEELFISKKENNKDMDDIDKKKIVNAILKFADLQNNREKDYIFDINKFSNTVGKTGPYILYTYLRINKILESENKSDKLNDMIYNDVDRNLRLKLLELENYLNKAFEERMPSYIAEYVYNICVLCNAFYQNNHIKNMEDQEKRDSWVYVLTFTNKILKSMMNLLIIDIPKMM